jgi:hypothetical protein
MVGEHAVNDHTFLTVAPSYRMVLDRIREAHEKRGHPETVREQFPQFTLEAYERSLTKGNCGVLYVSPSPLSTPATGAYEQLCAQHEALRADIAAHYQRITDAYEACLELEQVVAQEAARAAARGEPYGITQDVRSARNDFEVAVRIADQAAIVAANACVTIEHDLYDFFLANQRQARVEAEMALSVAESAMTDAREKAATLIEQAREIEETATRAYRTAEAHLAFWSGAGLP